MDLDSWMSHVRRPAVLPGGDATARKTSHGVMESSEKEVQCCCRSPAHECQSNICVSEKSLGISF